MYTQGSVRALTDDELRLYLSKLSKDELEALIGNLHEDLIPSITALLPRETDELLTE